MSTVRNDQHRLDGGADERILEILGQEPEPQRHGTPLQPCDRRSIERDRAGGRCAQTCERVERQRLARAVAAEDRNDLAGRELYRELAHQLAYAGLHAHGRRRQPGSGPQRAFAAQCVHRISRAVSGPMSIPASVCGMSDW
jgi:hypothetical protein